MSALGKLTGEVVDKPATRQNIFLRKRSISVDSGAALRRWGPERIYLPPPTCAR